MAFWLGFFAHSCCRIDTCERRNWEEFCVPIDDKGREFLRFLSKKALRAHQLCSSSLGGGHGFGGAPLAVVRSNECLWCRSRFSSVGAARQHLREAYEMGHWKRGFFGGEGSGPEIGEIENDDGESGDPAAIADVAPGACRVFFLPRKRHLRTVVVRSPPVFCTGVSLDFCSPEGFFGVGYRCVVIKTSLCKRVETPTCDVVERSTQHVERRWFLFRFF